RHHRGPGASRRSARDRQPELGRRRAGPRHAPSTVPPVQHREQQPRRADPPHRGHRGRVGRQGEEELPTHATRRRACYLRRRRRPDPRLRLPAEYSDRGRREAVRRLVPRVLRAHPSSSPLMVRSLDGRLPRDSVVRAVVSERLRVLIIGDFSASKVGNASVAEQLARKLTAAGDIVLTTSDRTNRLARVAGMVFDAARFRRTVDVAIVDVYAQAGFRWAEWTTYLLSAAGTPVVLVLRGGDLPTFAETRGGRVTRLFAASSSIV